MRLTTNANNATSTTRIARSTNNGAPPSFDLFAPAVVATVTARIGRGACRSARGRGAGCSIGRAGGRAGGGISIPFAPTPPTTTLAFPVSDGGTFIPPRGEGKIVVAAVASSSSFSSFSFSFDSTSVGSGVSSSTDDGPSMAGVNSKGELASNPQVGQEYSRDLFRIKGLVFRRRLNGRGTYKVASRRRSSGGASSDPTAPFGCAKTQTRINLLSQMQENEVD